MWDNTRGICVELAYVTMSLQRFRFILHFLRFDNVRDRDQRKGVNKSAHIPTRNI